MLYARDFRRIAREALTGRWAVAVGTGIVAGILGANGSRISNFNWSSNHHDTVDPGITAVNNNIVNPEAWTADYNGTMAANHDAVYSGHLPWAVIIILGITVLALAYALAVFFLRGAIQLGYCRFNKNLLDNNNPRFKDLFSSFYIFWRGFAMQFMVGLYTFLWTLLLIIPGIIAAYSYAMTPYILEENPYMPINEAIRRSKDMMKGNKWRLFCLEISFIGWFLLCILSCFIGFLWLGPYISAATAAFYYDVSGKYSAQYIPPNGPLYYPQYQDYVPYRDEYQNKPLNMQ